MRRMPELPAAASALVAPVVDGPRRGGVVVASFPTCVYAVLDDPDLPAAARLVAVLAPGALLLPGGIRLATGRSAGEWASGSVGDRVVVGSGVVELPGWSARMVRVWQPSRVRRRAVGASAAAPSAPAAPGVPEAAPPTAGDGMPRWPGVRPVPLERVAVAPHLVSRASALATAALGGGSVAEALGPLVGAGTGLTPSGDDAVCGVLLVLHGLGRSVPGSQLDGTLHRTTSLSAALLSAARQGYAVPEVVRLVEAFLDRVVDARCGDDAVAAAVPSVLAIGHSSGRDLVAGVLGALGALSASLSGIPAASDCHTVIRVGLQPAHRCTEGCGP